MDRDLRGVQNSKQSLQQDCLNFETGEIRNQFGRNVADYVTYTNFHFGQTFYYPDIHALGRTRIKVLVY